jgi:hypothetical protein
MRQLQGEYKMTKVQQKRFIRELIQNVQKDLLANSGKIPAEWDGHELRQLVADKFALSSFTLKKDKKRYRAYNNAILTIGGLL